MKYKNFYENAKEANLRLRGTVIWYDGPGEKGPYYVMMVCDHTGDDFKIYMKRTGQTYRNIPGVLPPNDQLGGGGGTEFTEYGKYMDKFMKDYPKFGVVRKDLSSPHFRAFRPFPLGMMNEVQKDKSGKIIDCETFYLERQPNRSTQQGLVAQMIYRSPVNAAMSRPPAQMDYRFDIWSDSFYDCCMGEYPDVDECLSKLTDDKFVNEAAAFSRHFAFVRGPIGMVFLSYKASIVGVLDNKNLTSLTVDREFKYTREAISELQLFQNIKV